MEHDVIFLTVVPLTQEIFVNVVNLPFSALGFFQFLFPVFARGQKEEENVNERK